VIRLKRIYDPPEPSDGTRFLVDRLWPRGMKKEVLKLDSWLRDVAPSDVLRRWFAHDPAKWNELRRRYYAELESNPQTWKPILQAAQQGDVTLIYSARDAEHNNAVALKAFLEERLKEAGGENPTATNMARASLGFL